MQAAAMECRYRKDAGKGPARRLRASGHIPAVLYRKEASTLLSMDPKVLERVLQSASGHNSLMTLSITAEGPNAREASRMAVLKELQRDPLTGSILHADFFEISMDETVRISVPVEITGAAIGVKAGGIIQYSIRELEIQCLPSAIPDKIRVDVSALEIGQAVHVREIPLDAGIKVVTPMERAVVSVVPPLSEAKMEAILTGGPKETKEPEVVGRKEKEGAEEATAGAGKSKETGKPKEKEGGGGKEGGGKDKGKK